MPFQHEVTALAFEPYFPGCLHLCVITSLGHGKFLFTALNPLELTTHNYCHIARHALFKLYEYNSNE